MKLIKRCPKCGEVKNAGGFYKDKASHDGLNSWCKSCASQSYRESYKNNREFRAKKRQQVKEWRKNNPEKAKEWRKNNPEKQKASEKRNVDNLSNSYVRNLIKISSGLKKPPHELIELKRQIMRAKRIIRENT